MRPPLLLTLCALLALTSNACDDAGASSDPLDAATEVEVSDDTLAVDTAADAPSDAPDLLEIPEGPWPIDALGPYNVGYRVASVTYTPEGADAPRDLRLALWYPTRERGGKPVAYSLIFPRPENVIRTPAPALEGGPLPVMLFSHGSTSIAEQSYFLTEYFASHGWLVAAPDHTGNTLADNEAGPLPPDLFLHRPRDISATLDTLQSFAADDPLAGAASEDVVVSGHSFGGYTAIAVAGAVADVPRLLSACDEPELELFCEFVPFVEANRDAIAEGFLDPRVDLIIPMSPGATRLYAGGIDDIDVPVLLMTADGDITTTDAAEGDPTWSELDGPQDRRLRIADGGHFTFSHLCDIAPEAALEDGCGEAFVDPDAIFPALRAYALAFARSRLFGDTRYDALLNGEEEALHPSITVVTP